MEGNKKQLIKYIFSIVFTILGFVIAIIENVLFPQVAQGVSLEKYAVGIFQIDANQALQIVLFALIVGYILSGILAYRNEQKRIHYRSRAGFRFAMGLLIGILDLTGTKLKVLPQPFFPGPAEILQPFLSEGEFLFLNTLYSLRLYIFGFSFGVLFGIGTGILIGWFDKVYYWVYLILVIPLLVQ